MTVLFAEPILSATTDISACAADNIVAQPAYNIHITEKTIEIVVNGFNGIVGDIAGNVVFVKGRNAENYMLFDITGRCIANNLNVRARITNQFLPLFNDDVATVHPDGQYAGIIDKSGEIVRSIANCFEISTRFVDGMATVIISTPCGRIRKREFKYINKVGNTIYPLLKQRIHNYADLVEPRPFIDGLSCYYDYTKKRYGYFDKTGKIIIPAQFTEAHNFSEGLAAVTKDETGDQAWGYIDTSGEYTIDSIFHNEPGDFHNGYAVAVKQNGQYVYINKTGKPCSNEFGVAKRFFNGYAFVCSSAGGGFDVIDTSLNIVKRVIIKGGCNIRNCQYNEDNSTVYLIEDNRLLAHDGTLLLDIRGSINKFHGDYTYFESNISNIPNGFINKYGEMVIAFVESEF